jgi:hypothetical protein
LSLEEAFVGRFVNSYRGFRVWPEQLAEQAPRSVTLFRGWMLKDIERAGAIAGARVFWSQWDGYLHDGAGKTLKPGNMVSVPVAPGLMPHGLGGGGYAHSLDHGGRHCPVYLATDNYISMNGFDHVFRPPAADYLVFRFVKEGQRGRGSMSTIVGESGKRSRGPGLRFSSATWPRKSLWKCRSVETSGVAPENDQVIVSASRSTSMVMFA